METLIVTAIVYTVIAGLLYFLLQKAPMIAADLCRAYGLSGPAPTAPGRHMNIGQKITLGLAAGAAFSLAMALLTGGAFAASECGPRADVVGVLKGKYQEQARAAGMISNMSLMEIYVSAKGTWTIVVTNGVGLTCVLAAGEVWDELPPIKKGTAL